MNTKFNTKFNTKQIAKLFFVVMLALFATVSSGMVAEQIGLAVGPYVYACGGNNGGGC